MSAPFDVQKFEALSEGTWRPTSTFTLPLPSWSLAPDAHELAGLPLPKGFEETKWQVREGDPDEGTLFYLDSEDITVIGHEALPPRTFDGEQASDLNQEDMDAISAAHYALTIEVVLGEPILEEFHAAIRLASAIAPQAVALRDNQALMWRSATWVHGTAKSLAPPSPLTLFTVHAVQHQGEIWLHTHGLARCGAIELEVLGASPDSYEALGHLLNSAAMLTIEQGTPEPKEHFSVGRGLEVSWLPWDQALAVLEPKQLGTVEDREGHDFLVGSLVAPPRRKKGILRRSPVWENVESLVPLLEDNPVFYVSSMETQRASLLASEHFPSFRALVQRFAGEADWEFLVKLGYEMDPTPEDSDPSSEHLWFEVHKVDGARIDATLLNEPYRIARFTAGDRDWHAADQLSDWSIAAFGESYGPGRIGRLLERVQDSKG